jgi:hypothetical protein
MSISLDAFRPSPNLIINVSLSLQRLSLSLLLSLLSFSTIAQLNSKRLSPNGLYISLHQSAWRSLEEPGGAWRSLQSAWRSLEEPGGASNQLGGAWRSLKGPPISLEEPGGAWRSLQSAWRSLEEPLGLPRAGCLWGFFRNCFRTWQELARERGDLCKISARSSFQSKSSGDLAIACVAGTISRFKTTAIHLCTDSGTPVPNSENFVIPNLCLSLVTLKSRRISRQIMIWGFPIKRSLSLSLMASSIYIHNINVRIPINNIYIELLNTAYEFR